ncbi:MAG: (2Fe-2S)-binding protein [Chloroflexi bacterium]|nr:(2Fe-2S)-binding protein [Chloroflexota bacterium]
MKHAIALIVNGQEQLIEVEPRETLLQVLRDRLYLTGTKDACSSGECGSCSVLLDGEVVNSCLTLAIEADGCRVTTIEGLARGDELHPLQRAFVEKGAVQCGYCSPGLIMTAKSLLDHNPSPTETDVKTAIVGNLCRCTGYTKIVEAILSAAEEMRR